MILVNQVVRTGIMGEGGCVVQKNIITKRNVTVYLVKCAFSRVCDGGGGVGID